ncbi:MAG TPA: hypothetical protein VK658_21335 [Chryseolinea sp.]|nr:hypothetical protein [Chryseolinea sp.]
MVSAYAHYHEQCHVAFRHMQFSNPQAEGKALLSEKAKLLITDVLNMPKVIEYSKVNLLRNEHKKFYGRIYEFELKDDSLRIEQQGHPVIFVQKLDDPSNAKSVCYTFFKIRIKGDTANIKMAFPISGLHVNGRLAYVNGHWQATKDLIVAIM